jgi:hypothetical protein
MSTTYEEFMASLGDPDHHILIGRNWWGCLCGASQGPMPHTVAMAHAESHIGVTGAAAAQVDYRLTDLDGVGPTFDDVHQWLWEQEAF